MLQYLLSLDKKLFIFLNSIHNNFFDTVMYWIGDRFIWVPFYIILIVLTGIKLGWKNLLIIIPAVSIMILISDQGSNYMKFAFHRLRPCHNPEIAAVVHVLRDYCGGQFGFVSSHAANCFAAAVYIGCLLKGHFKWLLKLMLLWAVFVAYSRIYTGVHYPADVIAGGLYGVAVALIILGLQKVFWAKAH